jgi:Omp85 superfamily domain
MQRAIRCALAIALIAIGLGRASAQDSGGEMPTPDPATSSLAPTLDVGDLWRHVVHKDAPRDERSAAAGDTKPFVVLAPTITSKPSTGLTAGLNGNIAFVHGDPATTHISSLSGGGRISVKNQKLLGGRLSMFTADDRWLVLGDVRMQWTSQNTFGLGGDTVAADAESLKYDSFHVYETAYRQIGPRVFLGAGLNVSDHANVRSVSPGAYEAYNLQHGTGGDHEGSGGTNVALLLDSRDNSINPSRGWHAGTTYRTFFDGFLGGDSSWQELTLDVRTYRALTARGRQKLAFWLLGDFVTGGTAPYLDLPGTATNDGRSARGYGEGRFRGPQLMYGEVEYRDTIMPSGLLGFVAFLNTTTVSGDASGEKLFHSYAPGAGLGLRVLLNKHSKTNMCFDYGWGKDGSRGLYLSLQEAF